MAAQQRRSRSHVAGASGYGDRAKQCPKFIPCARFFTLRSYLGSTGHESQFRRGSRRGITGGGALNLAIFIRLLYHANSIQCVWQSRLRSSILHFSCGELLIHLHQSCCSINQPWFCYSDHNQTLPGSYSKSLPKIVPGHCQSKFRFRVHWQPDFKPIYLQFLYSINA